MSLSGPVAIPVGVDVNVLVTAAAARKLAVPVMASPPATSGNPAADSLGVIVNAAEFARWLCPHIVGETYRVLLDVLKWTRTRADIRRRSCGCG